MGLLPVYLVYNKNLKEKYIFLFQKDYDYNYIFNSKYDHDLLYNHIQLTKHLSRSQINKGSSETQLRYATAIPTQKQKYRTYFKKASRSDCCYMC